MFNNKLVAVNSNYPFTVLSVRINPTQHKKMAESMVEGDLCVVQEDLHQQGLDNSDIVEEHPLQVILSGFSGGKIILDTVKSF